MGARGSRWASSRDDRGQQRSGDEQQNRWDEQQRDHELDLWRRAGGVLRGALGGASTGGARLGGERGHERRAVAVGPLERGDERRDPCGRCAALELCVGVLS